LDPGYSGCSGISGLSATEFEDPEVFQDQGKPRMHLTLP